MAFVTAKFKINRDQSRIKTKDTNASHDPSCGRRIQYLYKTLGHNTLTKLVCDGNLVGGNL